jgi:hypothetical protein
MDNGQMSHVGGHETAHAIDKSAQCAGGVGAGEPAAKAVREEARHHVGRNHHAIEMETDQFQRIPGKELAIGEGRIAAQYQVAPQGE